MTHLLQRSLRLVEELVTKKFTCVSVLLPSWQVVNDPLHSRLSIQVLSLEPCNTNPYWQENRTVLPTLKRPNRSPFLGRPGSEHCFSVMIMKNKIETYNTRPDHSCTLPLLFMLFITLNLIKNLTLVTCLLIGRVRELSVTASLKRTLKC